LAEEKLLGALTPGRRLSYDDLLGRILEEFVVTEGNLKTIIKEQSKKGRIALGGLQPKERTPNRVRKKSRWGR
jgi:hypothetical protein